MAEFTRLSSRSENLLRFVPEWAGATPYAHDHYPHGELVAPSSFDVFLYSGPFAFGAPEIVLAPCADPDAAAFTLNNVEVRFAREGELTGESEALDPGFRHLLLTHPGESIYGHWLIDILPRLMAAAEAGEGRVRIAISSSAPGWARRILADSAGDLADDILVLDPGKTYSGSVLLCSPTRQHDLMSTRTLFVRRPIEAAAPDRRIFVARRQYNPARELKNRTELEAVIRTFGFEFLYAEDHSIADQKSIFASAALVLGEGGSGLHNSVFCPAATKFLVVQSSRQSHFIQAGLCHLAGQTVTYFWGQSETDDWNAPFVADIDAFTATMTAFRS